MNRKQLKEVRKQLLRIGDELADFNALLRCRYINLCTLERMVSEGTGRFSDEDVRNYAAMVTDEFELLLDSLVNKIERFDHLREGWKV